jgi:hypothetical protein
MEEKGVVLSPCRQSHKTINVVSERESIQSISIYRYVESVVVPREVLKANDSDVISLPALVLILFICREEPVYSSSTLNYD